MFACTPQLAVIIQPHIEDDSRDLVMAQVLIHTCDHSIFVVAAGSHAEGVAVESLTVECLDRDRSRFGDMQTNRRNRFGPLILPVAAGVTRPPPRLTGLPLLCLGQPMKDVRADDKVFCLVLASVRCRQVVRIVHEPRFVEFDLPARTVEVHVSHRRPGGGHSFDQCGNVLRWHIAGTRTGAEELGKTHVGQPSGARLRERPEVAV